MAAAARCYLEGRVHETCVAQIAEATQAGLRLGLPVVVGGAVGTVATQPAEGTHKKV